jgi:uncharacterized protein
VARFRNDPQGFLDGVRPPAILDELQNVPEVFNFLRSRIDRHPRRTGQWILTGSQEAGPMGNVTESMAGRAAVLQLWPMSIRETSKVSLLRGGYPEVLARPRAASLWFSSYVQTSLNVTSTPSAPSRISSTFDGFSGSSPRAMVGYSTSPTSRPPWV